MFSCQQNEWDKHFDRSDDLPEETLYDLLKQDESLSKFVELIDIADYKPLLSSSQTYTVWALDNEVIESMNIDMNDKEEIRLLVSNHIARFNVSSVTPPAKMVRMINGKIYHFSGSDSHISFGGSLLLSKDKIAKNGLLHTIGSGIVYLQNLYEYIMSHDNTSKLAEFISTYDEKRFNEELSIPIDKDDSGRTVYDSVFTSYNRLFDHRDYGLGTINMEDSIYSMLIPTNTAWDVAYAKISPYFKVYNVNQSYADSVQKTQTSLAILNDLIYRGRLSMPSALDSISSTSGSVIHDINDLFYEASLYNASNGYVYLTNQVRYNNIETWDKPIWVEGEEQSLRSLGLSTSVLTRTVSASGISGDRYIEVTGTTPAAQPGVTFEIPQTLSGKYNIYAIFVPASIDGESYSNDSTRLSFDLTYIQATGRPRTITAKSTDFLTSGTQMVMIKAFTETELPISNYYDNLWLMDETNDAESIVWATSLTVRTEVSTAEVNSNKLTRRFRLDKIIFESVRN